MRKHHLLVVAVGAVAGYLMANSLVAYQPFTFAYTQGATLGTKAA